MNSNAAAAAYNAAKQAYPLMFMLFEQTRDFTWQLTKIGRQSTLVLKSSCIANTLNDFNDGRATYSQGTATIKVN